MLRTLPKLSASLVNQNSSKLLTNRPEYVRLNGRELKLAPVRLIGYLSFPPLRAGMFNNVLAG